MAKFFENFRDTQAECKINVFQDGKWVTMTTREYKNKLRAKKAQATRKANAERKAREEAERKAKELPKVA